MRVRGDNDTNPHDKGGKWYVWRREEWDGLPAKLQLGSGRFVGGRMRDGTWNDAEWFFRGGGMGVGGGGVVMNGEG